MPVLEPAADLNHQQLARYMQLGLLPDWVRQAPDAFPEKQASSLGPNSFADPKNRRYRCDTPAATYLSALYFHDNESQFNQKVAAQITERFRNAARFWQINNSYEELKTKLAALNQREPVTLPDEDFAIVKQAADGEKERLYPLRNAKEVRAAAKWLFDNRDHEALPFDDRHAVATKIVDKAAAFGAGLGDFDEFIERQAGRGFCTVEDAAELIRSHARASTKRASSDVADMKKLADMVEATPEIALDHEKLAGLAKTVDMFDRSHNLTGGYGQRFRRPEDVLFGILYKEASELRKSACQLQTGTVYDADQLRKLAVDDLRSMFGEEFVGACTTGAALDVEKLAEVAATLPFPDAQAFDRLMSEVGHSPIYKSGAASIRKNREQLAAAAATYPS